MSIVLTGPPVAGMIDKETAERVSALRERGVMPTLTILRIGARQDDLSYERAATKRCEKLGIEVRSVTLQENVSQDVLISVIERLNADDRVHGVLMFRPLPAHLDEEAACAALNALKDIDGVSPQSMAGVFAGSKLGYPPCTAQSCVEILKYYGVPLSGKRVAVIGRSLVIGRPVSMLLMHEDATVTICHSKSEGLQGVTREADIVVAAVGRAASIGAGHLTSRQTVLDVGVNVDANGKLCGDVDFAAAEGIVRAISPVPGGVGSVTTAVLASHVAEAAERTLFRLA